MGNNLTMNPNKKIPKNLGVCIMNSEGVVIEQDSNCKRICGERCGSVCQDGCMKNESTHTSGESLNLGFYKSAEFETDAGKINYVKLNDGNNITTLLFEESALLQKTVDSLKKYDLTSAELRVAEYVLRRFENKEIADELFISLPTLRTHLNNLYKKLPEDLAKKLKVRK